MLSQRTTLAAVFMLLLTSLVESINFVFATTPFLIVCSLLQISSRMHPYRGQSRVVGSRVSLQTVFNADLHRCRLSGSSQAKHHQMRCFERLSPSWPRSPHAAASILDSRFSILHHDCARGPLTSA